jgi:hypothetical protein
LEIEMKSSRRNGGAQLNDDIGEQKRLALYRSQVRLREAEQRAFDLFLQNLVKGTSHLSLGQEAIAAGFGEAMVKGDLSFCTYRGHAHTLARGVPVEKVLGELMQKDNGLMRGKGGSMHLTSEEHGVMGSYAIIGAHLPIACGAAWRAQYKGDKDVSVCFFGDGTTLTTPAGIAVLVTPWNFPAAMATRKIGPALAAGCPVVLKLASDTPLTMLALMPVLEEAGVPAGVVNVVPSRRSAPVVSAMLHNPRVRVLSFTGSTEVGRKLLHEAADCIIKPSMELGGNAPFIVFDDADVDAAIDGAMIAKMRNMGEACTAANRFYVHEKVHDEFAKKLTGKMQALKMGNGLDDGINLGPLVNKEGRDKVIELVDDAVAKGASVFLSSNRCRASKAATITSTPKLNFIFRTCLRIALDQQGKAQIDRQKTKRSRFQDCSQLG